MINKTKDSFDLRFYKNFFKIFNEVRELTRDIEGVTRESYGKVKTLHQII